MRHYLISSIALVVSAGCGSQPPSFKERPVVSLNFTVDGSQADGDAVSQEPLPSATEIDAILAEAEANATTAQGESADASSTPDNPNSTPDDATSTSDNPSSTPDNPTSTPDGSTPSDGSDPMSPDLSSPSVADRKACARLMGVDEGRIMIAGSKQQVTLSPANVIAAKIVGNQNRLILNLQGDGEASIAGICLFLAGNQASVEVKTTMPVSRMLYIGRGNQSTGAVAASHGGDVQEIVADLSGNAAVATFTGVSACPQARIKGQGAVFSCTPR